MTHIVRVLGNVPVPAGAVVGDWENLSEHVEDMDVFRFLTWSRHDAAGVVVAVEGTQYGDGGVDRYIALRPESFRDELTAADARRLAAGLLDAADSLDACGGRLR